MARQGLHSFCCDAHPHSAGSFILVGESLCTHMITGVRTFLVFTSSSLLWFSLGVRLKILAHTDLCTLHLCTHTYLYTSHFVVELGIPKCRTARITQGSKDHSGAYTHGFPFQGKSSLGWQLKVTLNYVAIIYFAEGHAIFGDHDGQKTRT